MNIKSGRAIAAFIVSVILCSIEPATAASTHVDANGNALADSEVADAPADSEAELAKQLQNPVASLISVPFQNNFDFNLGPNDDGFKYTLNFQPVIPVSLSQDWNLIIRTIVPIISQDDVIPNTSQSGLSDIVQSFFFSPKKPVGGLIIGFGPVMLYPSATDSLLGSEQWGRRPDRSRVEANRRLDLWVAVQSHLELYRRQRSQLRRFHFPPAIRLFHDQNQDYLWD